jgi:hypothetical protein
MTVTPVPRSKHVDLPRATVFNECYMQHEAAFPERSHTPDAPLFNLDAMSDREITVMYRGLAAAGDEIEESGEEPSHLNTGDGLLNFLTEEVRWVATRDPERVKGLVQGLAASEDDADRDFAARTARSLVHYDYEFTRDVLFQLMDEERADASEAAHFELNRIVGDGLAADQIAGLRADFVA